MYLSARFELSGYISAKSTIGLICPNHATIVMIARYVKIGLKHSESGLNVSGDEQFVNMGDNVDIWGETT